MPLILVVSVAAMSGGVERAGAACIGPYIAYAPSEVAPGSDIDVVGLAWGDNCYDTGPPPAGEGPLGRPADVDLLVAQGEMEWLVGSATANSDYRFDAVARVPLEVKPGAASLVARRSSGRSAYRSVWHFSITGAAPVQSSTSIAAVGTSDPVAPGGSTDPVEPAESRNGAVVSDESAGGWSTGAKVLLIAVLAVAVLAIPGFMMSRSQRA